jgi:hypothetical protein
MFFSSEVTAVEIATTHKTPIATPKRERNDLNFEEIISSILSLILCFIIFQ